MFYLHRVIVPVDGTGGGALSKNYYLQWLCAFCRKGERVALSVVSMAVCDPTAAPCYNQKCAVIYRLRNL